MSKGKLWSNENHQFQDPISGTTITQLTDYKAHSFHIYFTNCGWYDSGSKLLIGSDRDNCSNLFSITLKSGELRQVTDFSYKDVVDIQGTYINPVKNEAFLKVNESLVSLDLNTYEEKVLFTRSKRFRIGNISCTADGKYLCFVLNKDLSKAIQSNLGGGYVGFEETEAARPQSKICLLDLETLKVNVIHEEERWIGHVNASSTQPHLLTFCHEGPWEKVDHRIWVMDIRSKKVWKIRDGFKNQYAGHEYWHKDGIHIGYHGFTDSLEIKDGKFLGFVKYDNTEREEFEFPYQNMHIHSNDTTLIVGDGQQASAYHGKRYQDCIFLWKKTKDGMEGPRILCKHRGSFHTQNVHVHPRFSPDGTQILFTSDRTGYGNVYFVDVPEFETLPKLADFQTDL